MDNILSQLVPGLSLDEKVALAGELRAAIAEELARTPSSDPEACPRCGSRAFVRKGRDRDGSQRWLCRGCGRTFSRKTGGLLALSKLPAESWMSFAGCMADALPLRETARRVGVSLRTAWFMRMRVCEVMAARVPAARPGSFQVDGTLVRGSFSGNHGPSGLVPMPRPPRRNGEDGRSDRRGSVLVECGVNELGDCFLDAIGTSEAAGPVWRCLYSRVPEGSEVVTDGHASYPSATPVWRHRAVGAREINRVNALHSRLKAFLARFRGVSTRRLQRYLGWFRWLEHHRCEGADRRRVLYDQEVRGTYVLTRRWTVLDVDNATLDLLRVYGGHVNAG